MLILALRAIFKDILFLFKLVRVWIFPDQEIIPARDRIVTGCKMKTTKKKNKTVRQVSL